MACSTRAASASATSAAFDPLPITVAISREWGHLAAAVRNRGGQPRRRAIDLAIAATANVHGVPLLTHNSGDFHIIDGLVDVRRPAHR